YVHGERVSAPDAVLFLPDHPLASTHILKPQPADIEHMVVNEHYCMTLAKAMGLSVADVEVLRTPHVVLAVKRFDRQPVVGGETGVACADLPAGEVLGVVERVHIID